MDEGFAFEQQVRRFVERENVLRAGDVVVVGVSGGSDSVALLLVLLSLRDRFGLRLDITVAHLDHRLRRDSARDAAFVSALARACGVGFRRGEAPELVGVARNVEEAAREARTAFLRQVAKDLGANRIALGHTIDDQAETVLHRLARGAGVRGLAAMEARRADGVVRPLLGSRRHECISYLQGRGQEFLSDPTNEDRRFTRNRIRHHVLPMLSESLGVDMVERLATAGNQLRVEADLADVEIERRLATRVGPGLGVADVRDAGPAGGRLVHAWLAARGHRASREQVRAIVGIAGSEAPSKGVDLAGARVERVYGVLDLVLPDSDTGLRTPVEWRPPRSCELPSGWRLSAVELAGAASGPLEGTGEAPVVDAAAVAGPLAVRTVLPGDRIRLHAGRRKLSDLFIDRKIPRAERSRLAVVAFGDDIMWVPGIAVSSTALPGKQTEKRLRLRAERTDCRNMGLMLENQPFRVRFG